MSIISNHIKSLHATTLSDSKGYGLFKKDIPSIIVNPSKESSEDIEMSFRTRYANELKSKRQQIYDKDRGFNELDNERRSVLQQMMRTPGRRGEIIKEEEIYKEFSRRFFEATK